MVKDARYKKLDTRNWILDAGYLIAQKWDMILECDATMLIIDQRPEQKKSQPVRDEIVIICFTNG